MRSLKTSLIAASALLLSGTAHAQSLDMSGLVMQNLMFDQVWKLGNPPPFALWNLSRKRCGSRIR